MDDLHEGYPGASVQGAQRAADPEPWAQTPLGAQVADPDPAMEAPPLPFRLGETQSMVRTRFVHPTPRRAVLRPHHDGVELADEADAVLRFDFRDRLPPYMAEGDFNSGVAVAWIVVVLMSTAVMTWHFGPNAVLELLANL